MDVRIIEETIVKSQNPEGVIRLNVSPFQGSVNDISIHCYNPDIPSGFKWRLYGFQRKHP